MKNERITKFQEGVRRRFCATCPTPCGLYIAGKIEFHSANAECPLDPPRWPHSYPGAPLGLGDMVAKVAQPIARAIDKVVGTNIQSCGGCAQRKAALNKMVPNLRRTGKSPRQAPQ